MDREVHATAGQGAGDPFMELLNHEVTVSGTVFSDPVSVVTDRTGRLAASIFPSCTRLLARGSRVAGIFPLSVERTPGAIACV